MKRASTGCVIGLVSALLLLVAIVGFEIASYRPSFCGQCHEFEYSYWKRSRHSDATCYDCHSSRGGLASVINRLDEYFMVFAQLTGQYKKPITAYVDNAACMECHQAIVDNAVITSGGIRMRHKDVIRAGMRCTDCHNTVAHGRSTKSPTAPFMETCMPCHDGKKAPAKCDTCHVSRSQRQPTGRVAPWAVTHGPKWAKTHGMGNLATCIVCHAKAMCIKCHGMPLPHPSDWPALHGKAAIANEKTVPTMDKARSCVGCHYSTFCSGCHQIEMPHPASFLKTHPREYKRVGRRVCANCHNLDECNECHVKHTHPGKHRDPYLKLNPIKV